MPKRKRLKVPASKHFVFRGSIRDVVNPLVFVEVDIHNLGESCPLLLLFTYLWLGFCYLDMDGCVMRCGAIRSKQLPLPRPLLTRHVSGTAIKQKYRIVLARCAGLWHPGGASTLQCVCVFRGGVECLVTDWTLVVTARRIPADTHTHTPSQSSLARCVPVDLLTVCRSSPAEHRTLIITPVT